jgi:phosphoribosylaminoimidazole carboxylase PurE protein
MKPQVLIVMGSDSDLSVMEGAEEMLRKLQVPYEITVASAHRTPERAAKLASQAEEKGIEAIIAGAGMAAHLAGVLAAYTIVPVIGVPIDSSPLSGLDALLSTVQMPPGVPVAAMAIGKAGAKNAAIFSAQIIARKDPKVAGRLRDLRKKLSEEVLTKSRRLKGPRG